MMMSLRIITIPDLRLSPNPFPEERGDFHAVAGATAKRTLP